MQSVFTRKFSLLFMLAFTCIVIMQWAHFVFYFKQPTTRSFIWSITDWGVWFTLFACYITLLYQYGQKQLDTKLITFAFVIFAGLIQISVCSFLYMLMFDSDNTLLQSVAKSINKRWLQNVFIAGGLSLIAHIVLQKLVRATGQVNTTTEPTTNKALTLFDGKHHYRIQKSEISALCADKNYVSVFTAQQEIIIRSTLKSMVKQVNDSSFVQISRSSFVNKNAITALHKYSRTSFKVHLGEQHQLNVSKKYLASIQALIST